MSTFLELCNDLKQETDIAGPELVDVAGQTGEQLKLVNWIKRSYAEICGRRTDWKFLRSSFTVDTVVGDGDYLIQNCTDSNSLLALARTGFTDWLRWTLRVYPVGELIQEKRLPYLDWESFRETYLIRVRPIQPVMCFAVRETDQALVLGPIPDRLYTVVGDYMRLPPPLAAKDDVPVFDAQHHELIVWNALIRYMAFEEDAGGWDNANRMYKRLCGPFERRYIPTALLGAPLV